MLFWLTVSAPCAWAAAIICYALYRSALRELADADDDLGVTLGMLREEQAYVDGLAGGRDR